MTDDQNQTSQTSQNEAVAPVAPVTQTVPTAPVTESATAVMTPPAKATPAPTAAIKPAPKTDEAKKPEAKSSTAQKAMLQNAVIAGNIPQMVLYAISYALHMGASDVHIEPEEKTVRVRFRVDGMLRHIIEYPQNIHPAVVSRIKIMSNLKIDEQRIPQDGRTHVTTEDHRSIDLRISSLPTVNGEKIVMRLQDKTKKIPDLPELGLAGTDLEKMERFTELTNGIILVTGPTGSGKTNTLYSTLARLNKVGVNIMTFEDPVEYQMDGLSQSQMRPDIDYDFASGLRTALRQDPDIIMVGEIRDQETIEIAIRAALTGHLVLSTIHTNSAIGTLTRISDMGVKPFLITSAIRGIASQRLVRTICPFCKEKFTPDPTLAAEIRKELRGVSEKDLDPKLLGDLTLYKGKGCEACNNFGYQGRVAVFEILELDRDLAQLILDGAPEADLTAQAQKDGMLTMKQSGFIKALEGVTSVEEIYRITK